MRFPNKVNRYKTTVLYAMSLCYEAVTDAPCQASNLYRMLKKKLALGDFVNGLTCLYAIGLVMINEKGEVERC